MITAEAHVELSPPSALPGALAPAAWAALDAEVAQGDFWEALIPSALAGPTPLLLDLAGEWDIRRRYDPLSLLPRDQHEHLPDVQVRATERQRRLDRRPAYPGGRGPGLRRCSADARGVQGER